MAQDNAKTSLTRKVQLFLVDTALTVAGILSICGGLWSIWNNNATLAATCMAAGLILLFAATLHRFELLKGFGIEAKVKKLDDTIDQAKIALQKLKEVGELTSTSIVTLFSSTGRDGRPRSLQHGRKLATEVRTILEGLGTNEEAIRNTLMPWVRADSVDLAVAAIDTVDNLLYERANSLFAVRSATDDATREISAAMYSHANYYLNNMPKLELSAFPALIHECVMNAPGLDSSEKQALAGQLKPFGDEIEFLSRNFAYNNFQFWIDNMPSRDETKREKREVGFRVKAQRF